MSQRSYFKPLRRKIGVLTLAMACVFATGWVRSSYRFDGIEIVSSKNKCLISSIRGQMRWFYARSEQARVEKREIRFPSFALEPTTKDDTDFKDFSGLVVGDFYWMNRTAQWGHYSDIVQTPGPPISVHQTIAQVPYWSIVIPLTLLSAWLLLSRPRVKTEASITPTIETT